MMYRGEKLLQGITQKLRGLTRTQALLIGLLIGSAVIMDVVMMRCNVIGTLFSLISTLTLGMLLGISLKGENR